VLHSVVLHLVQYLMLLVLLLLLEEGCRAVCLQAFLQAALADAYPRHLALLLLLAVAAVAACLQVAEGQASHA
jgi:hypothetical protein